MRPRDTNAEKSDLLGLFTQRPCALVVPVVSPRFLPGTETWRGLVSSCLGKSQAHVFGLLPTHGLVPEASLLQHQDYFAQSQLEDEEVSLLGAAARARAWLDLQGPSYRKIVLLRHCAPLMRVWSVAVRGSPAASKVYIEKCSNEGLGYLSPVFHSRVRRRLEES